MPLARAQGPGHGAKLSLGDWPFLRDGGAVQGDPGDLWVLVGGRVQGYSLAQLGSG